jgi:hypothetical protein
MTIVLILMALRDGSLKWLVAQDKSNRVRWTRIANGDGALLRVMLARHASRAFGRIARHACVIVRLTFLSFCARLRTIGIRIPCHDYRTNRAILGLS